ncbi:MAG: SCO family protein [Verrucomicrobiota bacterium JB023]|nr:SCO family protein [Verrucomicrobiota bacterium JB023]
MSDKVKIILIYSFVAVFGLLLTGGFIWVRQARLAKERALTEARLAENVGRQEKSEFLTLEEDLVAVNQAGEEVRLSELEDKVWMLAEFFAECPMCAQRNADHLLKFYNKYKDHPDFHVVCVSVDPETDDPERLQEMADSLNVDVEDWWFLTGDRETLHRYMEKEAAFLSIRERTNPEDIEVMGRFAHDMGLAVIGRGMRMVEKKDLFWAREQGDGLYEHQEELLTAAIERELNDE